MSIGKDGGDGIDESDGVQQGRGTSPKDGEIPMSDRALHPDHHVRRNLFLHQERQGDRNAWLTRCLGRLRRHYSLGESDGRRRIRSVIFSREKGYVICDLNR